MQAGAKQRRLGLDSLNRRHEDPPTIVVAKPPVKIAEPARWALHGENGIDIKTATINLVCELVGAMEI